MRFLENNTNIINLLLELNWDKLTDVHTFIFKLVRASVLEIVKSNEVDGLIREGVFRDMNDCNEMIQDAMTFLPHKCSSSCQAKILVDGKITYRCRKINNMKIKKEQHKVYIPKSTK